MTNYGHPNTLPVTVDIMIQHAQAVRRGAPNCMVLVAMPYGSYATEEIGVLNALRTDEGRRRRRRQDARRTREGPDHQGDRRCRACR